MVTSDDLAAEALHSLMPGRPIRTYPAILSAQADALAWARAGAPAGAAVVAEYQASPRGRAGLEWTVEPGSSLCFSLVLRPEDMSAEREGWLYAVTVSGLADVLGPSATVGWPDEVFDGDERLGAVGVHAELGPHGVAWAVVSVLITPAAPPRGPLLRQVAEAVERRLVAEPETVLADHLARCRTIGRSVRARMIPMGPGGLVIEGKATGAKLDGALLIETVRGSHIAVRPQNLGVLEDAGTAPEGPALPYLGLLGRSSGRPGAVEGAQGEDTSTA